MTIIGFLLSILLPNIMVLIMGIVCNIGNEVYESENKGGDVDLGNIISGIIGFGLAFLTAQSMNL